MRQCSFDEALVSLRNSSRDWRFDYQASPCPSLILWYETDDNCPERTRYDREHEFLWAYAPVNAIPCMCRHNSSRHSTGSLGLW